MGAIDPYQFYSGESNAGREGGGDAANQHRNPIELIDATPFSLGLKTQGGKMQVIVPKNQALPFRAAKDFKTAQLGQREVLIEIYQGEGQYVAENHFLGSMRFFFPYDAAKDD